MLKIENFEVMGWEHAIRGMRNPMNSWEKSDSYRYWGCDEVGNHCTEAKFEVGDADLDLMTRLRNAGTDHRKFMRMLTVYLDITAPLYWWKEFDTYKVGTVANSCSTMHSKEFDEFDFSFEKLIGKDEDLTCYGGEWFTPLDILRLTIDTLNGARKRFLETKDKKYWWQMIQLLPASYNQKRTVMLNYEVLANIYKSRRNHKLDEWHVLCDWIEKLPYAELITGEVKKEEK